MKKRLLSTISTIGTALVVGACSSLPELPADIRAGVEANDPIAYGKAGNYYKNLQGVSTGKKQTAAAEMYRKGAELGQPGCQNNLGWAYEFGEGVPQNYAKARAWYTKAAEQNLSMALNNLGHMYEKGQGGPVDYARAKEYYERSMALGDDCAISNLGSMYYFGHGVQVDWAKALKLFDQAATMGNTAAKTNASFLRKEMAKQSPASIRGKTFSFYALRALNEHFDGSITVDNRPQTKELAWKWGNKHTSERKFDAGAGATGYREETYEYKKTGERTASISLEEVLSDPPSYDGEYYDFELTFDSPGAGTCVLEYSASHSGLKRTKATGRFTLK